MIELEDFFTARELSSYRKVKLGSMALARIAREEAAVIVSGEIDGGGSKKEFIATHKGYFRMAMRENSDNSTERWAHSNMEVETVVMSDPEQMTRFFRTHGVKRPASAVSAFERRVHKRMSVHE